MWEERKGKVSTMGAEGEVRRYEDVAGSRIVYSRDFYMEGITGCLIKVGRWEIDRSNVYENIYLKLDGQASEPSYAIQFPTPKTSNITFPP